MSRLYPGWGSAKDAVLEESVSAYSLGSIGREELEASDKVIMAQSMFRKVSRLRLPFPLTFQVTNPKAAKQPARPKRGVNPAAGPRVIPDGKRPGRPTKAKPSDAEEGDAKRKSPPLQYCGVLEFSGPEDKVFMPRWMMRNLRVKEGQQVKLRSVPSGKIPKGTLCRLQPHTTAFIDLAGSMDLRDLLEHAFRNYSVLSTGETIVVNVVGEDFKIDVVETQPGPAISLYGNLDLEVDFAPPLDAAEGEAPAARGPTISGAGGSNNNNSSNNNSAMHQVESQSQKRNTNGSGKAYVGGNVMSFSDTLKSGAGSSQNQTPSPKPAEPAGHNWGTGRTLNGAVVVRDSQTSGATHGQAPAPGVGATSNASNVPRRARRRPSKYASRTAGAAFAGNSTSLDPNLAAEGAGVKPAENNSGLSNANNAAEGGLTVFTGSGRKLQGGQKDQVTPTAKAPAAADAAAIRARRLRFLDSLEKAKASGEPLSDGHSSSRENIAVGSGLSAIRKAKAETEATTK